jgi:hypothetical protein
MINSFFILSRDLVLVFLNFKGINIIFDWDKWDKKIKLASGKINLREEMR